MMEIGLRPRQGKSGGDSLSRGIKQTCMKRNSDRQGLHFNEIIHSSFTKSHISELVSRYLAQVKHNM